VNKSEGIAVGYRGRGVPRARHRHPAAISAAHGEGVRELMDLVLAKIPRGRRARRGPGQGPSPRRDRRPPNVGKSTLVNALVGEERVIAFDQPGTDARSDRSAVRALGSPLHLIDTAGVRRRGRTGTPVEFFSDRQGAAGDRGGERRRAAARRARGRHRAGRARRGLTSWRRGRAVVLALNKLGRRRPQRRASASRPRWRGSSPSSASPSRCRSPRRRARDSRC